MLIANQQKLTTFFNAQLKSYMYPLTTSQIEEVFFFIDNYVVEHNIACETLEDYFESSTDSFVGFMLAIEKHFAWFDYSQSPCILEILDIFIQKAHKVMYSEA